MKVQQERIEGLMRQIHDLESKNTSLQLTIDRLSGALAKSENDESQLKDKLQNLSLTLNDSTMESHQMEERLRQTQQSLAAANRTDGYSRKRLDAARQSASDAKRQNHQLMEKVQQIQNEASETELRGSELDQQLRTSHELLKQRQSAEDKALEQVHRLQSEKRTLQEQVGTLQRAYANLEADKRELERSSGRLEKDKTALKKTLDKVEREKIKTEEMAIRTATDKGLLDQSVSSLKQETAELQQQVQTLQSALAETEQQHAQSNAFISAVDKYFLSLVSLNHIFQCSSITQTGDRCRDGGLRTAQAQSEKTLEARERAHRQTVKGLKEQNNILRDQLEKEMKKRQSYINLSSKTTDEIQDLRQMLSDSLHNVSRDPTLDPLLLEHETKKLDDSFNSSMRAHSPPTSLSPRRLNSSRHRSSSPVRLGTPSKNQLPLLIPLPTVATEGQILHYDPVYGSDPSQLRNQ
ncbi:putative rootletin isoform X2 [Apostichopus japonicus]|uniref:Putative rootletin isoform X2 n=1 Tax=Stichopus japonicus TaxID=307972 RepID=A0A2G8JLA0_STIJA|nr:putative rootletin isoform X2 [Apostichopus japonicus]